MLYYLSLLFQLSATLIAQSNIVSILAIAILVFLVLLILGIRKSFKLRAQNRRISRHTYMNSAEDRKVYKDFKDGHLYG
jgi:hypothetical protein